MTKANFEKSPIMTSSDRISRSFALEQTYVHEVYEQYYDNPRSKPWPKVQEFLEKLEPGALVCDVGCGNGKYLKVNMSIYNLGGEKSIRLSDLARQNKNEVLRLDNLALPFKDNCFDTVLSLSVIHHFATTDRRVRALREMARVLRVGGKMIITVWAMEQDHRKFESQDVLVPWRRPPLRVPCDDNARNGTRPEDVATPHQADNEYRRSFKFRNTFRKKSDYHHQRRIPPEAHRKTSSGSSSLSSPSETCYGFVRRALQKIAGGGKRVAGSSWFLENWIACMHKQQPIQKRYDSDGCEYCECSNCDTVDDQPIELLRIDDEEPRQMPRRQTCPVSQMSADIDAFKSKSMNNLKFERQENNNNRCKLARVQGSRNKELLETPSSKRKPKLVKQKKSVCEEDAEEALDQPTDMVIVPKTIVDIKTPLSRHERGSMLKQRSLNEEILSADRLREKERLRQNIQKQTSLNEDLIYKRTHTFESLKDSFFAVASAKSFQMLKNGLTSRLKNSTTMERVAGTSIKNGFVKILQTWKGSEPKSPTTPRDNETWKNPQNGHGDNSKDSGADGVTGGRRHSKEDGSDSSKDSSLQSDTSVDSEDSFASVIFVPKSDPMSPIGCGEGAASPASPLVKAGVTQSAPQSPRIKQSSCPTSPRVKQMPGAVHPLTKQLSSPKPSTEQLPTTAVNVFFSIDVRANSATKKKLPVPPVKKTNTKAFAQKYAVQPIPQFKRTIHNTPNLKDNLMVNDKRREDEQSPENSPPDSFSDTTRAEKLKKIREMLAQKPGFGTKSKNHCPIVRKISDPAKKEQSLVKPIPKLLKLDIFNPVEDDDSDNSCVSSPDSVGSASGIKATVKEKFDFTNQSNDWHLPKKSTKASTNDEALDGTITSRPKKKLPNVDVFSILQRFPSDTTPLLEEEEERWDNGVSRRSSNTWNEECHKHLTAFADQLSEKLMKELDEYQLSMDNTDDPYIHRLSEELHDLSILSEEIKKQNEYLTRLADNKPPGGGCAKCNRRWSRCACEINRTSINRTKIDRFPSSNCKPTTNSFSVNTSGVRTRNEEKRWENGPFFGGDQECYRRTEDNRPLIDNGSSSESFDSSDKGSSSSGATSINFGGQSVASSVTDLTINSRSNGGSTASLASTDSKSNNKFELMETLSPGHLKRRDQSGLSDLSADSWPSEEVGGEVTFHRYYHVFRQGELEKLIEKYVDDLHVVSSTYEHASWCIIAEKVQIWTI